MVNQVPKSLIVGDTFAWERDLSEYPAPTWVLKYFFSTGQNGFAITAAADGPRHVVSVPSTSTYRAGRYRWHARVTNGTETYTIDNGWTEVKPNPEGSVDWRSHARKMVDAIQAVIENQATKDQLDLVQYSVGSSVHVRRDKALLLKMLDRYRWELLDEEGGKVNNPRNIYVRLNRV
jgi:hypothetical protein